MNKVILMGRLAKDPEIRYSKGEYASAVARFHLAVDRKVKRKNDEQPADFISCVAFGKTAEHVEKYYKQGMRMIGSGRILTGSYINRDGVKVYTTDVVMEEVEFAENKNSAGNNSNTSKKPTTDNNGFMNILDGGVDDLPFN